MPITPPWLIVAIVAALAAGVGIGMLVQRRRNRPPPLPKLWSLTPRPVFSTEERMLFRQLREALPEHVVLSKLPLVRFCQPADPQQVRYWFELLGHGHVSFAICSVNGRVLAAVDFESDRSSRRSQQIKEAVLNACRVRYVRCDPHQLLSLPEIKALVPVVVAAPSRAARRRVQPTGATPAAAAEPAAVPPPLPVLQTSDPMVMWQPSNLPQDSVYGFDDDGRPGDGGAVVVDGPVKPTRTG